MTGFNFSSIVTPEYRKRLDNGRQEVSAWISYGPGVDYHAEHCAVLHALQGTTVWIPAGYPIGGLREPLTNEEFYRGLGEWVSEQPYYSLTGGAPVETGTDMHAFDVAVGAGMRGYFVSFCADA